MRKTLRRVLISVGLSTGLLTAMAGAAHALSGTNHCQPLVRSR
jgi:hypothetical protein